MRYYAQELLAVMAIGCSKFLQQSYVLEAVYECTSIQTQVDDVAVKLYEGFCDRIEAKSIPFLEMIDDGEDRYQLELPMPREYIFGPEIRADVVTQDLVPQESRDNDYLPPLDIRKSMSLRQRATLKRHESTKQMQQVTLGGMQLPPISRGS